MPKRRAHDRPLKRHWFHILLALAEEDLHGSGIVRSVLDHTDGDLKIWPAMLYGSLDSMRAAGWIEELTDPGERPDGESQKKRFYRLRQEGRAVLAAEASRMASLATAALDRLSAAGGPT